MKRGKYFLLIAFAILIMPIFVKAKSVITVIEQGKESDYKITNNYGWTFNFKNTTTTPSTYHIINTKEEAQQHNITIASEEGYYDGSKNYYIESNSDCSPDKINILYKNVGMYQGKTVNLKISVRSCDKYDGINYTPNIGFSTVAMQVVINGLYSVDLDYEFINDAGEPIDIKGYGTFTDLDVTQAFKMGNGIDKAFIYEKYTTTAGELKNHLFKDKLIKKGGSINNPQDIQNVENAIQSSIEEVTEETIEKYKYAWSTVLFSGGKFNLTYYLGSERGMYVFTPDSLVPFAIEDPVKSVNKETISKNEEYVYTTSHRVPYINLDGSNSSYTAYSFNDVLEPCLNVKDVSKVVIKNDEGTDVTKNFDIKLSENNGSVVVDAVSKSDFLTKDEFYGHEYEFIITAYVKDNYDLSKYLSSDKTKYVIPNQAKISITDNAGVSVNKDTNQVFVYIPIPKEVVPTPNTGKYTSIALIVGGILIIAIAIITLVIYKKKSIKKAD